MESFLYENRQAFKYSDSGLVCASSNLGILNADDLYALFSNALYDVNHSCNHVGSYLYLKSNDVTFIIKVKTLEIVSALRG